MQKTLVWRLQKDEEKTFLRGCADKHGDRRLVITWPYTKIGDEALKNNIRIKEAVFSDCVREIGKESFSGCTRLRTVDTQKLKKIKNGDKEEIRVKKDSPEVIFKYNNVIFAIFYDMTLGFCIGLTVVFFRLCEMTNCMLPSDVEEAGVKTYTQNEILKIANKLLADNRKNENADDVDKNPYAAGVHDGILDVLTNLKIDSKEKFLN